MEDTEKKTEVEKKPEWQVVEVPTGAQEMIRSPEGKNLNFSQAIVHILNSLENVRKAIVG